AGPPGPGVADGTGWPAGSLDPGPADGAAGIRRWHAELAWTGAGEVRSGVLIEAAEGLFRSVTAGVPAAALPAGTVRLAGLTLPGLANSHSHAFHRALRGGGTGAAADGDTFWTWRERMYAVA